MLTWFELHSVTILTTLGLLGVLTFIGSLIALPILVARLPADYFSCPATSTPPWRGDHPARSTMLSIGRNLLGLILVIGGIGMLFLPGQGLLTLAIGLLMMDFPRKRAFQAWVLSWKPVQNGINWLRRKANRPEFELTTATAVSRR